MAVGKLKRKGKKGVYYYRATLPVRERGKVVRRQIERSTGTDKRREAEEKANEIDEEHFEAARLNRRPDGSDTTFDDAVMLYLQNRPNAREAYFLDPLSEELGNLTLNNITQAEVQRVANKLYGHCKPITQARQVYDPILAVFHFAERAGLCGHRSFEKPKGWNRPKRVMSPPDSWYAAVMPHLSPKLRAFIAAVTTHGRRASEFLMRTPDDIDRSTWPWTLYLNEYDKAGVRVQIVLAEHVIEAIRAIPDWENQRWLFGTKSVDNVNRDIRRACDKAGIPSYGTHAIGRHKAARNFLRSGGSLKGLQDAYGWSDPRMPMQHYGHEEFSEITEKVHETGRDFFDNLELPKDRDAG